MSETEKVQPDIKKDREELEIILDDVVHKVMGKALDFARISGMADRSLAQFSRSLKDYTNELLIYTLKVLQVKGYIKNHDTEDINNN